MEKKSRPASCRAYNHDHQIKYMRKQHHLFSRLLAMFLVIAMVLTMTPQSLIQTVGGIQAQAAVSLSNPRIVTDSSMQAGQKVTWDCVWFGSYPQTEIVDQASTSGCYGKDWVTSSDYEVDASLYSQLQTASYDSNGDTTIGGKKYRRIQSSDATYTSTSSSYYYYYYWSGSITYHYFRYDPIKWRVLNTSAGKAFLLADLALDDQRYNTSYTSVTWETSTMRSWLNGYGASVNSYGTDYSGKNFIGSAFTLAQKNAIVTTTLANEDNLHYGTEGGNSTSDKVFLLSESDVYNTDAAKSYGFVSGYSVCDEARRSKSSSYAKAMGTSTSSSWLGNCCWWLRSVGEASGWAAIVYSYGGVSSYGSDVYYKCDGCRPALNLNLLSSDLYSYAGTVCSDGTVNEAAAGESDPIDASSLTVENLKQKTFNDEKLDVVWDKNDKADGYYVQCNVSKDKLTESADKADVTETEYKSEADPGSKIYVRVATYKTVNGQKIQGQWTEPICVNILDRWSIVNSTDSFKPIGNSYYITMKDYEKLLNNLEPTDIDRVIYRVVEKQLPESHFHNLAPFYLRQYNLNVDNLYTAGKDCVEWNGSCEGLSYWTYLINTLISQASFIESGASTLYEVINTEDVQSAINYCHVQQFTSSYINRSATFQALKNKDIESNIVIENAEELIEKAEKCQNGGNPVIVEFSWATDISEKTRQPKSNSSLLGHAIIAYGVEEGSWTYNNDWKGKINLDYDNFQIDEDMEFTTRVLMYDCSNPDDPNGYNDWYITDNGTIFVPNWTVCMADVSDIDRCTSNGSINLLRNDRSTVDYVGYNESSKKTADETKDIVVTGSSSSFKISNGTYSATIDNGSIIDSDFPEDIIAIPEYGIVADDQDTESATITYVFPKSEKYIIDSSDSVSLSVTMGDTYYKYLVVAVDKKGQTLSISRTIHACTTGGKVTNVAKVTTAAKKNKVSLKKGKTFKLKARVVKKAKKLKLKNHRALAYESSNTKIATVSKKGVIKGVGKGTCYVYAYAQNGVYAKIKVTVK